MKQIKIAMKYIGKTGKAGEEPTAAARQAMKFDVRTTLLPEDGRA